MVEGYHVKHGTSVRRKGKGEGSKIEQKEVDVLFAVEALNHAYRGNAPRMVFVTGDLDFRPLLETLVDMGQDVALYAAPRAARDLVRSADSYVELTLGWFWEHSTYETQNCCPEVKPWRYDPPDEGRPLPNNAEANKLITSVVGEGTIKDESIELTHVAKSESASKFDRIEHPYRAAIPSRRVQFMCADVDVLRRYMSSV